MIKKISEDDNFIAQSLEHFFKFFLLLIDNQIEVFRKKVQDDSSHEKNNLFLQINSLNEKIQILESTLKEEKTIYEKEYAVFRLKMREDQEVIGLLKRDLDDVNKKLSDSQNLENADFNITNLMKSVNSFNNCLEKIDGENVFF